MILVDMEMPKACNECWLYNEDMECCIVASGGIANRFGYNNSTKPEWCPIKAEIPDNVTNEDKVWRSDAIDLFGHGSTYTSEEAQKMIKNLPSVEVEVCGRN